MEQFDIRRWVYKSPEQRPFRQAVHTILMAISGTPTLQNSMIMKGAILLALGYESTRFTKDIDFSTATKRKDFDVDGFRSQFETALVRAVEQLDYGLDCRMQGFQQKPPGEDKAFPTLKLKVGYADKSDVRAHKRLRAGNSPHVVEVDYSLNEPPGDTVLYEIEAGKSIQTYSFHNLVGEKFRALLQQEVRNRIRRQDSYDLYFLLGDRSKGDAHVKEQILSSLKEKAAARQLEVNRDSMRNPAIRRRSQADYRNLESEIEGALPPFDEAYETVMAYYEGLPWGD